MARSSSSTLAFSSALTVFSSSLSDCSSSFEASSSSLVDCASSLTETSSSLDDFSSSSAVSYSSIVDCRRSRVSRSSRSSSGGALGSSHWRDRRPLPGCGPDRRLEQDQEQSGSLPRSASGSTVRVTSWTRSSSSSSATFSRITVRRVSMASRKAARSSSRSPCRAMLRSWRLGTPAAAPDTCPVRAE